MPSHQAKIRNFSIISHINHGKSTLADRFLEITKKIKIQKFDRIMDSMELEQERGITIKLNTAQLKYQRGEELFYLNLIDTPGHIDFTYEVSRSLAACQGAVLLVDASKGIQAQTITNLKLAQAANLKIIPVINKIDLEKIDLERVIISLERLLKIERQEISFISAKKKLGIEELLTRIVKEIPSPQGTSAAPLQGLIFDAYYDQYQGVTCLVYLQNGTMKLKEEVQLMGSGKNYQITNLLIKTPQLEKVSTLTTGEVGLFQANIKNLREIRIGETITHLHHPSPVNLGNYKKINHVVFANFFATNQAEYKELGQALGKIQLTDSSFAYQKSFSEAFGNGFHCAFLGLLHLEIIQARVEREYHLEMIVTFPTVKYQILLENQSTLLIENLSAIPDWKKVKQIAEPIVAIQILTPASYLGKVFSLLVEKRGQILEKKMLNQTEMILEATIPMAEIVVDFFDHLKAITNGYASFDYQFKTYQTNQLNKLDVYVNKTIVPAFARIVHQDKAYQTGKKILELLKTTIPKHNFEISLQIANNNKIIARENIKAMKKNVTAKCYGGDITRKKKLWKKQKLGKKRMKLFGKVKIPSQTFLKVLKTEFKTR